MAGSRTNAAPTQTQPPGRRSRRAAADAAPPPERVRRTLNVGTPSIIGVLTIIVALAAWGIGATSLLIFGDPLSRQLIAENSEMQDRYEESLSAYRSEISRLAAEIEDQNLTQTDVGQALTRLARRQREIELRLGAIAKLTEFVTGTSIGADKIFGDEPPSAPAGAAPPPTPPPAPPRQRRGEADIDGTPSLLPTGMLASNQSVDPYPLIQSDARPNLLLAAVDEPPPPDKTSPLIDVYVARLEARLDLIAARQQAALNAVVRQSEAQASAVRDALQEIGVSPDFLAPPRGRDDTYFPNIPLSLSDQKSQFGERIQSVRNNFILMNRMRSSLHALPIQLPTPTNVRFSSPFGMRKHPIAGTMRLHAGVDMAAPEGTPIRAAGSGVVLSAGWGGGYGNLVQINHGNGIVTRYAHLSTIETTPGTPVSSGAIIGRMGTTGASTGTHLHFETRVHGNPSNPACFLLAGDRLARRKVVPFGCDSRPAWSKTKRDEEEEDDDN